MAHLPVDPQLFLTFLGMMAVMAITPGPANIFAVASGMTRGRAAALIGVLGMNTATLVWFGAAALGLGALIQTLPQIFRLIALGGALYVAWLGIKAILGALEGRAFAPLPATETALGANTRPSAAYRSAFRDGFLVQIANPKAILFFTAVLPPFLDIRGALGPQLGLFATTTIGMDIMAMSLYALGGMVLAQRMTHPRFARIFGLAVGILLLLAAGLIGLRLFD